MRVGVQVAPVVGVEAPAKPEPEHDNEANDKDEQEAAALLKFGASTSPNPSPRGTLPPQSMSGMSLEGESAQKVTNEDMSAVSLN